MALSACTAMTEPGRVQTAVGPTAGASAQSGDSAASHVAEATAASDPRAPVASGSVAPPEAAPPAKSCTEMGCVSGVSIVAELPIGDEDLPRAKVTTCRNGRCYVGSFEGINAAGIRPGSGRSVTLRADGRPEKDWVADCSLMRRSDSGFRLRVLWEAARDVLPKSGDVYTLVATDGRGRARLTVRERVNEHKEHLPNGPGCAPRCRMASIDRTNSSP
jgi:hypothetical protein